MGKFIETNQYNYIFKLFFITFLTFNLSYIMFDNFIFKIKNYRLLILLFSLFTSIIFIFIIIKNYIYFKFKLNSTIAYLFTIFIFNYVNFYNYFLKIYNIKDRKIKILSFLGALIVIIVCILYLLYNLFYAILK